MFFQSINLLRFAFFPPASAVKLNI